MRLSSGVLWAVGVVLAVGGCTDQPTSPDVRPGDPRHTAVQISGDDPCSNCTEYNPRGGDYPVAPAAGGGSGADTTRKDTIKPCNTGYATLDDPKVQAGLADLFRRSNPDSVMSKRREQGGWLVHMADGTFDVVPFPSSWNSDPCQIHVPATYASPPNTIGMIHTHPYTAHEQLTNCPPVTLWNGRQMPQNYNGDSSADDDSTMASLRTSYPTLFGIVIDKDHIIAYDGSPNNSKYIDRCGY